MTGMFLRPCLYGRGISVGFFAFLVLPAFALSADPLTLDLAIARALSHNPTLAVQKREYEAAYGKKIAQGSFLPSSPALTADIQWDGMFRDVGEHQWSVGLSQEFEIAGQWTLRRKVGQMRYEKAHAQLQQAERLLRSEVTVAYDAVLYRQKKHEVLQKLHRQQEKIMRDAKRSVALGVTSQFDYDLLTAEHASLLGTSLQTEAQLVEAQNRLRQLLALEREDDLVVTDHGVFPTITQPLATLQDHARAHNWEIKQAHLTSEASRYDKQLKGRAYIPNPHFFVKYIEDREQESLQNLETTRFLFLGVEIPLPITGHTRGVYLTAQGEALADEERVAETVRKIAAETSSSYIQIQKLRQVVDTYVSVMERMKRNIDLLEDAYVKGRIPLDGLLVKRERFIAAAIAYYDSQVALTQAHMNLEVALGSSLSEITGKGL